MFRRFARAAAAPGFRFAVVGLSCLAAFVAAERHASAAASNLRACDYYQAAGTPCVAAQSTTRALFAQYAGPLYAVKRASDGRLADIGLLAPGGYADAAAQDAFCAGTTCVITTIYDQSPSHNDLTIEAGGGAAPNPDVGARANALPVTAGGHQVYGVLFSGHMGYRNDHTLGVATNGKPETMVMVTSGTHTNNLCCFDYGNAETNNRDNGNGHMDALNYSTSCNTEQSRRPWVKADMENGLYASDRGCDRTALDRGRPVPYVTALLKNNGQNFFALKHGDAQSGPLTTSYSGPEPDTKAGYSPLHQEGAIVLGTGGDNSNGSIGSFFEGVMTAGVAPDYADDQVQADIVHVGYGGSTGSAGALQAGSQISLMTEEPNASVYLAHRQEPEDAQRIVGRYVDKETPVELRAAATWIVRQGFSGSGCLAFESQDLPGAFLRHVGDTLVAAPDDGSASYAGDSTFCPVTGLAGSGSSFQAQDLSGAYVGLSDRRGVIASARGGQSPGRANRFKQDASFLVTQPLAP